MARFLFQDKYNSTHAFYKLFTHKKTRADPRVLQLYNRYLLSLSLSWCCLRFFCLLSFITFLITQGATQYFTHIGGG